MTAGDNGRSWLDGRPLIVDVQPDPGIDHGFGKDQASGDATAWNAPGAYQLINRALFYAQVLGYF